jgi:hypothetical protein
LVETSATSPPPDMPVANCASCATSPDEPAATQRTESLLSLDVERQVREMIRTIAMNSVRPKGQNVKDVAATMREHLVRLRKRRQRPMSARMAYLMEMHVGEGRH